MLPIALFGFVGKNIMINFIIVFVAQAGFQNLEASVLMTVRRVIV